MTATSQTDALRVRLDLGAGITELTRVLVECCEKVERERLTAIVLELGEGSPAWPGAADVHAVNKWERALRRFERLDAVTAVTASGESGGPALEVLMVADIRVGTPGLRLGLPMGTGGFWPGMVLHRLSNRIGVSRTRQLVMVRAGQGVLTMTEACDLGLVDEITDNTDTWITTLLAGRPSGTEPRLLRSLVLDASSTSFEEALGTHLAACDRAVRAAATTSAA